MDRQNVVKARIVELRQRISEIASIDPNKVPRDKASYGSTLVLYDAEKDEEVTYRLVTPEESDPAQGLISTTSPVGRSLMGKQEGDEVVVLHAPGGASVLWTRVALPEIKRGGRVRVKHRSRVQILPTEEAEEAEETAASREGRHS